MWERHGSKSVKWWSPRHIYIDSSLYNAWIHFSLSPRFLMHFLFSWLCRWKSLVSANSCVKHQKDLSCSETNLYQVTRLEMNIFRLLRLTEYSITLKYIELKIMRSATPINVIFFQTQFVFAVVNWTQGSRSVPNVEAKRRKKEKQVDNESIQQQYMHKLTQ